MRISGDERGDGACVVTLHWESGGATRLLCGPTRRSRNQAECAESRGAVGVPVTISGRKSVGVRRVDWTDLTGRDVSRLSGRRDTKPFTSRLTPRNGANQTKRHESLRARVADVAVRLGTAEYWFGAERLSRRLQ